MAGRPEEYAAVMLAEQGLCVGRQVGEQYLFDPDSTMPRDEFLAMCTHLTGTETRRACSTGFETTSRSRRGPRPTSRPRS
ncbi:MAG: hypothetical protein ACLTG4_06190 [Oscillospiraceae bacterium]